MHYSWLDHIVSSQDFHHSINDISVLYEMSDDDHIPVCVNVSIDHLPASSDDVNDISAKIKWDAVTDTNRNNYYLNSYENLGKIKIPVSAICCSNTACEDESHKIKLNKFYGDIVSGLQVSSKHIVKNDPKHLNKPGWSDYVSDLHKFSRETYKLWLENGKPRQGTIHDMYAKSKRRFKYAVRFIKKHEDDLRREAIAKKLSDNNSRGMWREINNINNSKVPLPTRIEEATNSDTSSGLYGGQKVESPL